MSNGGLFRNAIWSADGKLVIAPAGNRLNLFSSITGELVDILQGGHEADITCVSLVPKETNQVYSTAKDGMIRQWDYSTGKPMHSIEIRETVRGMVVGEETGIAHLSINWRDGGSGRVIAFDIGKKRAGKTAMKVSCARPLTSCGGSNGRGTARNFVATFDRHSLFVWRLGPEIQQPLNLHHTKPYTCVAISSDETLIAAGDVTGRILIWRNFSSHVPPLKKEVLTTTHTFVPGSRSPLSDPSHVLLPTTLHWHASAVGCLSFSSDGVYLLSGGREGVLVIWQVETGRHNFLPRLGGPLISIVPSPVDSSRYLIGQADNTLRVVNTATMKVETSMLGLRPLPIPLPPHLAANATLFQPGTGHLLVPCENAELQIFDTIHNRHVGIVRAVHRNYVGLSEKQGGSQPGVAHTSQPYVSHSACTGDGRGLVTVDVRPDAGPYGSQSFCLKFWDLGSETEAQKSSSGYVLNTRVDEPHSGGGGILSLACHPYRDLVVTTGGGGGGVKWGSEFRLWTRAPSQRRPGGKSLDPTCWSCLSTGGYRDLPLMACAFSPDDGSVLAIAAGSKVTLWSSKTCQLAAVLPSPSPEESSLEPMRGDEGSLRRLAFIPGTTFLTGSSDTSVMVWDLLTMSLVWSLNVPCCSLAADPVHKVFSIAVPLAAHSPSPSQGGIHRPPSSHRSEVPSLKPPPLGQEGSSHVKSSRDPSDSKPPPGSPMAPWQPLPIHCSHILLFRPQSKVPILHGLVQGTLAPNLMFVPMGLPQHASLSQHSSEVSPLMVLTEGRAYSFLTVSPDQLNKARVRQGQEAGGGLSAFEEVFGKIHPLAVGQSAKGDIDEDAMDVDSAALATSTKLRQALFDAPSHALPPPTDLASAFLRILTTNSY